jgi:F-type H+-transporting ATPase subunit c
MKNALRHLSLFALVMLFAMPAFAQDAGAAKGYMALAAAIGIGVAALGGTLAQGRAAAAALDGIARNPGASGKIFVPMLLGLALIESLVVLAFVIAFGLSGKV